MNKISFKFEFELREWERIFNDFKQDFPILFKQGRCLSCKWKGIGCGADCKDWNFAYTVYQKAWNVFLDLNPQVTKRVRILTPLGSESKLCPKKEFLKEVNKLTASI